MKNRSQKIPVLLIWLGAVCLLFAACKKKERPIYGETTDVNVSSLVVTNGNGTIHVSKSAGQFESSCSWDNYEISGDTMILIGSFSDIYVQMSSLKSIHILDGNSSAEIDGDLLEKTLKVDLSGNATIKINNQLFNDNILDELNLDVYNNGTFNGFKIPAKITKVTVHENGYANVRVTDELNVTILSNGHVNYKGSPSINQSLSFQAKLRRKL